MGVLKQIPKEYIKELEWVTKKCGLTAKEAEQLLNICLKVKIPPKRTAATIAALEYGSRIIVESYYEQAKESKRAANILAIMNTITNETYAPYGRIEKEEYKGLVEKLKKNKKYFGEFYSE